MIEALLIAVTRVVTLQGERPLTNATGFFFERDGRLFLITSRHVVWTRPQGIARINSKSNFTSIPTTLPK